MADDLNDIYITEQVMWAKLGLQCELYKAVLELEAV